MTDMVKMAKRQAMLDAQTKWLEEAEKGETLTLRTVSRVIADAFGKEAELYKEDINTRAGGWGDEWLDGFEGDDERRSHGDVERGTSLTLLEKG
jgi:hypothetical protein